MELIINKPEQWNDLAVQYSIGGGNLSTVNIYQLTGWGSQIDITITSDETYNLTETFDNGIVSIDLNDYQLGSSVVISFTDGSNSSSTDISSHLVNYLISLTSSPVYSVLNEYVALSNDSSPNFTLPNTAYRALTSNQNVRLHAYSGNNECYFDLNYNVLSNNVINIANIIENQLTSITVGEAEATSETVFVSKTNLAKVWNNLTAQLDSKMYTKTSIDTKFNNVYEKAQTYSATQINSLLGNKANTSTTYTKSEVDSLINQVTLDTYTKSEVDDLVENAGHVDMTNYYTKTEIDNILNGIENGSY